MAVRIGVLGAVRVWVDGVESSPGAPLRCAALSMLALRTGRLVTMSELVEGLWGERAPASAEGSVYTYVSGLRSVLEPDRSVREPSQVLEGDRSGYVLRMAPDNVDALAAEADRAHARQLRDNGDPAAALTVLDGALALWRGEALAGVPGPAADVERTRLTGLRWALLEERAEIALVMGRHAEIAAELTALVREQPLRERLVGVAMTALYRGGRQADALEMFGQVRAMLADELGVDPGPDLARLYEQILRNDPALDTPTPGLREVATLLPEQSGPVVPAQLPHDVAGFTGREAELAWLRGLISSDVAGVLGGTDRAASVVISAIDGCGGIGKTALAVRLAHEVVAEFPDGQLCVDLRGFDPQLPPLDPGEALSRLLRGLGQDIRGVPDELDVQAAQYRSLIGDKRMLILLDNAVSTEQVRELLPGSPGCLVVVTSRNRLGGLVARHGARRLTLDVLSESDAVTLSARMIGADRAEREPEALLDLVELCGRFPLALRIAAERVSARSSDPVADLVIELRGERDRLDVLATDDDNASAVRAVFSWSYHGLNDEEARLFRLLSVHPGSEVSVEAAAAITDRPVADTRKLMRSLADGHLIEDAGRQRYRFHDLVRVYAAERAAAEDPDTGRDQALWRVLNFYLDTADRAAQALAPGIPRTELDHHTSADHAGAQALRFAEFQDAADWIDREQNTLVAVVRQAARAGEHRITWQLVERIREMLQMQRTTTEWLELVSLGLESARLAGDQRGRATMLNQRGYARIRSCEYEAALEDLDRARSIFLELGDTRGAARALGNIANVHIHGFDDPETALPYYLAAGELLGSVGDLDGQARALGGVAGVYAWTDRYDEALEQERKAHKIFQDLGHGVEQLRSEATIAGHELRAGRPKVALPLLQESLAKLRSLGDQFTVGICLTDLACCYRELGDLDASLSCGQESVELLRSMDPGPLGGALLEVGATQRSLGWLEDARQTFTEAIPLASPGDERQLKRLEAELATLDALGQASA
jgi:DNA-binding SARP family transcriptional activator/tetratricopeptide (TPR) repeat protein